jgi:hypothetical protein
MPAAVHKHAALVSHGGGTTPRKGLHRLRSVRTVRRCDRTVTPGTTHCVKYVHLQSTHRLTAISSANATVKEWKRCHLVGEREGATKGYYLRVDAHSAGAATDTSRHKSYHSHTHPKTRLKSHPKPVPKSLRPHTRHVYSGPRHCGQRQREHVNQFVAVSQHIPAVAPAKHPQLVRHLTSPRQSKPHAPTTTPTWGKYECCDPINVQGWRCVRVEGAAADLT